MIEKVVCTRLFCTNDFLVFTLYVLIFTIGKKLNMAC